MSGGRDEASAAAGSIFGPITRAALPSRRVRRLHLLRHGPVETGGERRVYGHLDLPLSAAGRRLHEALVPALLPRIRGARAILSSDLSRCRDLAERLARATGLPLSVHPELREQAMGAWEGRSWEELTAQDEAAVHAWWADYSRARPPGGESLADLEVRVGAFLAAYTPEEEDERLVLVSHVGPIRLLLGQALGLPRDQALRFAPAPGSHSLVLQAEAGGVLEQVGERLVDPPEAREIRRIALSGSAGTGKSTLAQALARQLDLPYLAEPMRRRLEAGLDLHGRPMAALILELWEEQAAAEEEALGRHGGFVADRSPCDFMAFWLHYGLRDEEGRGERLFAEARARLTRLDAVLLLPFGAIPLVADGVRDPDPWRQRRFQALVEGVLRSELAAERLWALPPIDGLPARLTWVLDRTARPPATWRPGPAAPAGGC